MQANRPMHIIEQVRGYPYMDKHQLATEFNVSTRTVDRRRKGIEEEIQKGRYSRYAIIDKNTNVYVFMDYSKFEKMLRNPVLRKCVPPFEPEEIMRICGFSQQMRILPET